jgi:hypothetical protein
MKRLVGSFIISLGIAFGLATYVEGQGVVRNPGSVSISGANAAASTTGAGVPASASYTGINIGGNLTGLTGKALGATEKALSVAIMDASGVQITTFGGGTQYANASAQATPTGTVALGWDGTNVRALSTNASGQQSVVFPSAQSVNASQTGTWSVRAQDGSGNVLTSATRGAERALSVQIVDGSGAQVTTFGGSGGTASNFGSAVPATGTASGFSDGTNMQLARVFDTSTRARAPSMSRVSSCGPRRAVVQSPWRVLQPQTPFRFA